MAAEPMPPRKPTRAPPRPFPWDEAMRFGFGVLRLSSRDFWCLTPRELAAAMPRHITPLTGPPERHVFEALMTAFPDHISKEFDDASSLS